MMPSDTSIMYYSKVLKTKNNTLIVLRLLLDSAKISNATTLQCLYQNYKYSKERGRRDFT